MKRLILGLAALILMAGVHPAQPALAESDIPGKMVDPGELPLCLPEIYPSESADCLVLGPAEVLTSLAKMGYTIPPSPIPSRKTPAQLAEIPYQYARINEERVPIFTAPPASCA